MTVTHNFASEAKHLRSIAGRQRDAMAGAINDTLFAARGAVIGAMSVFDRATPFTKASPWVVKAHRVGSQLQGELVIPTEPRSAGGAADVLGGAALGQLPAGKPLLAEVAGGPRRFKRSEKLLHAKGILPTGYYAVPGPAAQIDSYGNWTRGQILHLLSYFQAFPATTRSGKGMRSNLGATGLAKLKRGVGRRAGKFATEYFVVAPGTKGLRPGIYLRRSATRRVAGPAPRVRAVVFFVTRVQYQARYPFHTTAERSVTAAFVDRFQARLAAGGSSSSAAGG